MAMKWHLLPWVLFARLGFHGTLAFTFAPESHVVSRDVVVVGAGQAGMAAAHQLRKQGYSVLVLEATDHVGGRTRNFDVDGWKYDEATDDVMEVGGTWLSPEHSAALALCRELGIDVYNASFVGDLHPPHMNLEHGTVNSGSEESWPWWFWGSYYPKEQTAMLGQTVLHSESGRSLFRTPAELGRAIKPGSLMELDSAGKAIRRAADSLNDSCYAVQAVTPAWRHLDQYSTWAYLASEIRSKDAAQALRNCIHGKNAQEPEAVSALFNVLSFKGCNSGGSDSQYRVRGGTQAIPIKIASQIHDDVILHTPVSAIRASRNSVTVESSNSGTYLAKAVIVTGPPPAVLGIKFEPPLEAATAQLLQRMPMGTSLKFAAVYEQGPWWRELGLQGDILATVLPSELSLPAPDTEMPIFVQCMDHSPFSRRLGVIACFMEGRQNLHFTQLSETKQRSLLTSFLTFSFNDSRAETFSPKFVYHNWADQPYARGAYTGYMPPGVLSAPAFWTAFNQIEKIPNVFLAGSDYHSGFGNGYIEGAIRDGQKAAGQVHDRLVELHASQVNMVV